MQTMRDQIHPDIRSRIQQLEQSYQQALQSNEEFSTLKLLRNELNHLKMMMEGMDGESHSKDGEKAQA